MPKLKQPDPLQKVAFDVLLQHVERCCDQLSVKGSLEELRRGISMFKKWVCDCIPWHLSANFCARFLDEFYSKERPASHHKAALEFVMDIKIVGLRCKGPIVAYLDLENAHRIQTLEELDLSYFVAGKTRSLSNFQFRDLTEFVFARRCSNLDLKVIGQNCLKLKILKVPKSDVTDEGLQALSKCSELCVVDVSGCPVSHFGINELLSTHRKIEELILRDGPGYSRNSGIFSHLDLTVCPSMRRFVFQNERDASSSRLPAIVAKFPHLNYLKVICFTEEVLSSLKDLESLTELEIFFNEDMFYDEVEQTWRSLKVLLTFIGGNITVLKFSCWNHGFFWNQEELDFLYETCPNVEHLEFDRGGGLVVIPPFQKLKKLHPRIPIEFEQIEILEDPELEFNKLPNLETLWIINYGMSSQAIESIILDDVKFPNLSSIETNCLKPEDLAHIERTVKSNNLDFNIKNDPESNWYVEYRFGGSGDSDDDAE